MPNIRNWEDWDKVEEKVQIEQVQRKTNKVKPKKEKKNETKINTVPKCNINNTFKLWNWYDVT